MTYTLQGIFIAVIPLYAVVYSVIVIYFESYAYQRQTQILIVYVSTSILCVIGTIYRHIFNGEMVYLQY